MQVVFSLSGVLQPKGCHKVHVKEDKIQVFCAQKQRGKAVFPNEKYDSRKGHLQRTQRDIEAKGTMTATKPVVQRENSRQECLTAQR